jgi:SAM-dependent methyltransferase
MSAATQQAANWSEELEEFHEESSRDHPIERLTREMVLTLLQPLISSPTIVEVGCSTGYLLEDLGRKYPTAGLIGFDLVPSGLRKLRAASPGSAVAQADVRHLPLPDRSADGIVSVNLLEHVANDRAALSEIRRVLRPGAMAVVVVPTSPGLYDYYDRFLHHERRYAKGELAAKARGVGLTVESDFYLGSIVYPAFWAIKKRNRLRLNHLVGTELEKRVRRDYVETQDSRIFALSCGVERWLLNYAIHMPFGMRGVTVLRRSLESI